MVVQDSQRPATSSASPSPSSSSSMPAARDAGASTGTASGVSGEGDGRPASSSETEDHLTAPTTSGPSRSWTSPIDRHPPPPRHPSSRRTSLPPSRRQLSIQQQLGSDPSSSSSNINVRATTINSSSGVIAAARSDLPPRATSTPRTETKATAAPSTWRTMQPAGAAALPEDGSPGAATRIRGFFSALRGGKAAAGRGASGADSDEPKPSEHPGAPLDLNTIHLEGLEDPRRWADRTKWINTVVISLMGFASPMGSSIVVTTTVFIDREFHLSSRMLSLLPVSFFVLGLGMGPFILAPVSELRGRQPVYLWSSILFTLFNLGTATVRSNVGLDVLRFFAGAMGSAGPSLGAGSIGDMFVPSERGKAQSLYGLGPLLGPVCGTIAGGWIAQSLRSWRWTLWVLTIFSGVLCVIIALFLRETFSTVLLRQKRMRVAKERLVRLERSDFAQEPAILDEAASLRTVLGLRPAATASVAQPTRTAWFLLKLRPSSEARTKIRLALTRPPRLLFSNPICAIFSVYMGFVYGLIFLFLTQHPLLFQRREDREDDDDGPRPRPPGPPPLPSYNWRPGPASLSYIGLGLGFMTAALINALLQGAIYRRLEASGGRIGWFLFLLPEEIEEKMREEQRREMEKRQASFQSAMSRNGTRNGSAMAPSSEEEEGERRGIFSRTWTASTDAMPDRDVEQARRDGEVDVESQNDVQGVMNRDEVTSAVAEGVEDEKTPAAATTTTMTVDGDGEMKQVEGVVGAVQPLQHPSEGLSSPPPPFAALVPTTTPSAMTPPQPAYAGGPSLSKEGAVQTPLVVAPMASDPAPAPTTKEPWTAMSPTPSSRGAQGPPSPSAVPTSAPKKKGRPEYRLPLCLLGMIILPCGLLVFGWAADSRTHWVVPLVGSYLVGMGSILPFQTILVYLVDAFFPYSASATACAVMVRSILAAIFPLFAQSLFYEMGYGPGCSLLAAVSAIAIPVPPLLWRYGQFLREKYRFNG